MRTKTRTTRAASLLLATTGLLGLTGVTAAHAAVPGGGVQPAQRGYNFALCSNGTYASEAQFTKRGNFTTFVVMPGSCTYLSLNGISSDQVVLYGFRPDGSKFKIATDTFDDADGERIRTLGTPDNNDWTTF
ncbi:hypothetical protein [Kitasatospora sp. NPDC093558]|uniref:hypothetical protein n=1 Tax=Kitasatospora sp. NPDC093558 TaxID=3155201 RepID=UPI00343919B9